MKRILTILVLLLFVSISYSQEMGNLYDSTFVTVRTKIRAKHLEKRFWKFGVPTDYQVKGKRYYLYLEDGKDIIREEYRRDHLLTKKLRSKLIKY